MRPSSNNNFSSRYNNNEVELYSLLYRLDDIRENKALLIIIMK